MVFVTTVMIMYDYMIHAQMRAKTYFRYI